MSRLKLTDSKVAEEGYDGRDQRVRPQAFPSLEGMKNMQRLLAMQNPRLADVNPANLLDVTLMHKLEDDGFFNQLQSRYRE